MHQQPDLILERQPGGTFLPRNLAAPRSEAKFPANRPLELLALEDRVLYSAVPLDPQLDPPEPEPTTEPLNLDSQLANLEHWAALLDVSDEGSLPSPTPATARPTPRLLRGGSAAPAANNNNGSGAVPGAHAPTAS
ncbi:MAG: hypothetical protein ACK557_05220, partial [Planctomycetota bacterium]